MAIGEDSSAGANTEPGWVVGWGWVTRHGLAVPETMCGAKPQTGRRLQLLEPGEANVQESGREPQRRRRREFRPV
jgi:hypothetical protein